MKLTRNQKGQGLVEYIILVALVVMVCVGVTTRLGEKLNKKFSTITQKINDHVPTNIEIGQ